jgi:glycosyltransferase involved in cell wall biosynthesis
MPTKIAEFLATGRPVVVNRGLGDLDWLLPDSQAGVVLRSSDPEDVDGAADSLLAMLKDPATPGRCRALASRHFDIDVGVRTLLQVYDHARR